MHISLVFTSVVLTSFLFFLDGCTSTPKEGSDSSKALLHLQVGTSHLMKGNFPQALRELLEAERLDPNEPTIQNNLGLAYLVREKYDDAEKHFRKALDNKSDYTDARNNIGRLYIEVGLYKKAIEELETAAADLTYEQPEKSWSNLGQAYFMNNEFQKAKMAFKNSLKNRRGSCFTMNYYGRSLFELKEYKTAAESLDQAVKLCESEKFEEPNFYSAMSFYKLGKVEQARARFEEVMKIYPNSLYAKKAKELLEIMHE